MARAQPEVTQSHPARLSGSHRPALAVRAPQVIKTFRSHTWDPPLQDKRTIQVRLRPLNIQCSSGRGPQPSRSCAVFPGSLVGPEVTPRGFRAPASIPAILMSSLSGPASL